MSNSLGQEPAAVNHHLLCRLSTGAHRQVLHPAWTKGMERVLSVHHQDICQGHMSLYKCIASCRGAPIHACGGSVCCLSCIAGWTARSCLAETKLVQRSCFDAYGHKYTLLACMFIQNMYILEHTQTNLGSALLWIHIAKKLCTPCTLTCPPRPCPPPHDQTPLQGTAGIAA